MQETVTTIILAILGSNALVEIIRWFVNGRETPTKIAIRALCEDRLGVLLRDWLHSDERLADDWRIIENLYDGYKSLGGNGEIKKLFLEASDLKTTE